MFEKYDAYKDSGVEWIGKIPTDWFNERLGTILEPISIKGNADKDLLSITREKGVILRDVEDDSENHNFIPDDLSNYKLIEKGQFGMNKMKAWQGSYGVSPYTGIVSPAYYIFKFIKPIYPDFFHWAIRSKTYISFFGSASDGVRIGQWDLSKDRMKNIPFVFPNIDSQKKIVEFIQDKAGKIDQAIAIKEQQIALLNERKQIVIQKAVTQGLNSNVPMKDSGVEWIGQIPEHWETYFNRRLFRENSRPVKGDELPLSLSQKDGVIPSGEMKERSLSPSHRNNFKLCFPNDLVVNRFKGHLGVFFQSNYTGIVTFHYGVFEPAKNVYTKYFELLYHTEQYKTLYAGASNGMSIGLQNLSNLNFYRIKSIVPPLEEQKLICEYADKVENEHNNLIQKLESQIEKLKEYKTTLINDAVTGKIKVA
ncbi:restriction endonuclease subunit S [Acinetobacter portensis]|uniref:restriction endonuclease subunit S n=1 Tax=Acinetobacter portensis TaxID=1839785 RepID=UPI0018EFA95E|nr:restriction endonuclease subunit S [Acinetobacter portensis]